MDREKKWIERKNAFNKENQVMILIFELSVTDIEYEKVPMKFMQSDIYLCEHIYMLFLSIAFYILNQAIKNMY